MTPFRSLSVNQKVSPKEDQETLSSLPKNDQRMKLSLERKKERKKKQKVPRRSKTVFIVNENLQLLRHVQRRVTDEVE